MPLPQSSFSEKNFRDDSELLRVLERVPEFRGTAFEPEKNKVSGRGIASENQCYSPMGVVRLAKEGVHASKGGVRGPAPFQKGPLCKPPSVNHI